MPRMVSRVLANARKAKGSGAARLAPAQKADLAKAAADWSKNGANASDESFKVLARYRASRKGANASAAGPRRSWGDAVGKPRRPPAVEAARIRAAGGSLKDQAAAHRASKGSRVERLQALDTAADRRYQAVKGRALSDKGRTVAYDRSVEISRHLYRAQEGKQTLAKGRGTAERAKAAEALKGDRAAKLLERIRAERARSGGPKGPNLTKWREEKPAAPPEKPKPRIKAVIKTKPLDPSEHTNHAPGHVGTLSTKLLHADPERFQYKLAPGAGGNTGSLTDVKKWDDDFSGLIQVWKDPANGKTYVVNGHNRLHLANRLGVDKVNVRFLRAKDAAGARAIGALTNIAEGQGTALDAAKFFRDTGMSTAKAIVDRGIAIKKRIAEEGFSLSRLHDKLFKKVNQGELAHERAVIIGGSGLTDDQQLELAKLVDKQPKSRPITNNTLREMVDTVRSAHSKQVEEIDLFGSDTRTVSLGIQKAALQAHVKERLAREKRLFGTVAKSRTASELERGNNKIDTEASGAISQEAAEALAVFDRLKSSQGPIAHHLNLGASRLHDGENAKKVYADVYREVLARIPEALKF